MENERMYLNVPSPFRQLIFIFVLYFDCTSKHILKFASLLYTVIFREVRQGRVLFETVFFQEENESSLSV